MKKIGIISCSNGLKENQITVINKLEEILISLGIEVTRSTSLFALTGVASGSGKDRANELIKFYKDPTIDGIFDVSGGDLANEVLEYINFDVLKNNPKPFFGYSDLSVILNSIYSQSSIESYLYQIRNIVSNPDALDMFKDYMSGKNNNLFNFDYNWVQGNSMEGIVVGGNLRCALKLAGTKFMPDFKDKILLIESLGGDVPKITTYLTQYKLMGAFDKINGIILGTFTEMENNNLSPSVEELIVKIVDNPNLPIIKTNEIGHSNNSKCISIGKYMSF
ncbi:S66 family peptidase [Clostridium paraputrificum]|uniref:S66 family peptidase n=1 Tax=Clostridium TaxID=1485 RepID=UPI003D32F895